MIIVHYEVYVLEGRGWMLHARFPRTERETAINEAKELEQTLNVRVKVLRETYYTEDNAFDEAEVYISGMKITEKSPSPTPPSRSSGGGGSKPSGGGGKSRPSTPARAAPRAAPAPVRRSPADEAEAARLRQVLARLVVITAISLAFAMLAINILPDAIKLAWKMGFTVALTPDGYGQALFLVFVGTFLSVAVPLSLKFLPRKTALPTFNRPNINLNGGGGRPAAPRVDRKLKKSLDKLADKALKEEEAKGEPAEEAEEELPPLPDDDLPPIVPDPEDDDLPDIAPDPDPEPEPQRDLESEAREEERKRREQQEKDKAKEKEKAEKEQAGAGKQTVEAVRPAVTKFVDSAVAMAKNAAPAMDQYNKFALHLYMAGAIETLCEFRKLPGSAKGPLVENALEALGTRGDLARKFHEKLEEYIMEPRYMGVFQAGRDAMGDFMSGDEVGATKNLTQVFNDWNKKAEKKAQIMTVMFTDMVGSTDLTQERGDAAAQEIVRKHNQIVRGALAQFGGKEVKHTGDGIMASFDSAVGAVEATVLIQRQVIAHNQRMPDLELHLRIGLNAGEPIQEENDLFGTTVQLSARVCAATDTDQILCTGVVKELAHGKGASFRSMGEKNLKGFKEPIALYEVVWR